MGACLISASCYIPEEKERERKGQQKVIELERQWLEAKRGIQVSGLTGKGSCQVDEMMEGLTMAMFSFPPSSCTTVSPKALL